MNDSTNNTNAGRSAGISLGKFCHTSHTTHTPPMGTLPMGETPQRYVHGTKREHPLALGSALPTASEATTERCGRVGANVGLLARAGLVPHTKGSTLGRAPEATTERRGRVGTAKGVNLLERAGVATQTTAGGSAEQAREQAQQRERELGLERIREATEAAVAAQELRRTKVYDVELPDWGLTAEEQAMMYTQLPELERIDGVPLLTASQLPSLLGSAPWGTRAGVIRDSVRRALGLPSDFEGNRATAHGVLHESAALAVYNQHMRTDHEINTQRYTHHTQTWLGATPDYVELVGDEAVAIGEIKCPYLGFADVERYLMRYRHQIQAQLYVTGADMCDFIIYDSNSGSVLPMVVRVDAHWWEDYGDRVTAAADEIRGVLARLCSKEYLSTAEGRALLVQYVY